MELPIEIDRKKKYAIVTLDFIDVPFEISQNGLERVKDFITLYIQENWRFPKNKEPVVPCRPSVRELHGFKTGRRPRSGRSATHPSRKAENKGGLAGWEGRNL